MPGRVRHVGHELEERIPRRRLLALLEHLPSAQAELGADPNPIVDLLSRILEAQDATARAIVFAATGEDPGPTVEISRPGERLPAREPAPRPLRRRQASAADWAAVGLPVAVVAPQEAGEGA